MVALFGFSLFLVADLRKRSHITVEKTEMNVYTSKIPFIIVLSFLIIYQVMRTIFLTFSLKITILFVRHWKKAHFVSENMGLDQEKLEEQKEKYQMENPEKGKFCFE